MEEMVVSSKTSSTFSVLHEILKWSENRPDWQPSGAIRMGGA
jgi:hypothetical protein